MKPEIKYEEGKFKLKLIQGIDADKDAVYSAGVNLEVFIDAQEALNELFKAGIPDWAKKIIEKAQPQAAVEDKKEEVQA